MTKEEKIKEAWGGLMPDYTNIDLDNGWSLNDFYEEDFNDVDFHTMQIYTPCKIRPKSLQGIEDNNGWIKIESEEVLPKKGTNCHFILKNGVCGVFVDIGDSEYLTLRNRGTHYQPIEKPKPPIY